MTLLPSLVTETNTISVPYQRSFLQWVAVNTETNDWSKCNRIRNCVVISPIWDICTNTVDTTTDHTTVDTTTHHHSGYYSGN